MRSGEAGEVRESLNLGRVLDALDDGSEGGRLESVVPIRKALRDGAQKGFGRLRRLHPQKQAQQLDVARQDAAIDGLLDDALLIKALALLEFRPQADPQVLRCNEDGEA